MKNHNHSSVIVPPIIESSAAKWAYFSLIFSGFYFFYIVSNYDRYTTIDLALVAGIYCLFLLLFVGATRTNGLKALGFVIAIIVLSGVGVSINPGTNALFGYAAFLGSYYFFLNKSVPLLLFNIGTQLIAAYVFDYWHPFFLGPPLVVSISLFFYGLFSRQEYFHYVEQTQKNDEVEQLSTIAERERIARDMHDLLGHTLSSLALKSELAQKLIEKQQYELAAKEANDVATLARHCLSEVRYAVSDLKQQGLAGVINQLVEELKAMGIKTSSTVSYKSLSPKVESAAIMVCKESVTNILKHSSASSAAIAIQQTVIHGVETLQLEISDNGMSTAFQIGNGLQGISTRVKELGGHTKILHSEKSAGFGLKIDMPAY